MDSKSLLEQSRNGLHILHESHYMAAKRYEGAGRVLGIAVVLLSAAAGTTVLQGLPANAQAGVVVITSLAAFVASAFAAVQTFLAYPALAERHRTAAHRYGELRREVERLLAFPRPEDQLEPLIADMQTRWNEADIASPSVPQRILKKAPQRISRVRTKMAPFRSQRKTEAPAAPATGMPGDPAAR
jgi:hypothetical protein